MCMSANAKGGYKRGIMMWKLKRWMDKGGHYVEMKGWMQKGAIMMCK